MIFKRKFRWVFQLETKFETIIKPTFVKMGRPTIEETEINFLDSPTWIPGKSKWQTLNVTLLGNDNDKDFLDSLVNIGKLFAFGEETVEKTTEPLYIDLQLLDGCGVPIEGWIISNASLQSINSGYPEYTSEIDAVELTFRYEHVRYVNHCTPLPELPECTSYCNTSMGLGQLGNNTILY